MKVAGKLVMPRREQWVSVPEYNGFKFRMWVNAPQVHFNTIMGQGLETPVVVEPVLEEGETEPSEVVIAAAASANEIAADVAAKANTAKLQTALAAIVVEHNGWCDYEGNELPPSSDAEAFWESIPQELANTVLALVLAEVGKLGSSVQNKKRN